MHQSTMVTITPRTHVGEEVSTFRRLKLTTWLIFLQSGFVILFGCFLRYAPVAMPNRPQWRTIEVAGPLNDSLATINATNSTPGSSGTSTVTTPGTHTVWVFEIDPAVAAQHEIEYQRHIPDNYAIYQDLHVMMFVGMGFLVTYLYRYGLSSISYNFLLGSMCIQWATLTDGWIRRLRLQNDHYIYVDIKTMINSDFALCSALVSFGAVLGKVSLMQLTIMGMFQMAIYQCNCAMVYDLLRANDPGCSMTVHTFGAYFGLTVAAIVNQKEARDEGSKKGGSVYHSDLFAMIGTLFLWTLYPSFNSANSVGEGRIRAIINTYFSLTASVMSSFAVTSFLGRDKFNMMHVQNASIAGGVAVGTIAEMIIQPWGAILVGFVAGIVSTLGFQYLTPCLSKRLRLHDTRGINNIHGLPGLISAFGSILAAGVATTGKYGDGRTKIFWHDRTLGQQAGYQAAALAVTLGTALLGGIITGLIMLIPLWDQPRDLDILDDEPRWVSVVDIPDQEFKSRDMITLTPSKHMVAVTEFTAKEPEES